MPKKATCTARSVNAAATSTPKAANAAHKGEVCHGLRFTITDRRALRAVDLGIALATILYRRYPTQFDPAKMTRLLVHPATMDAIKAGRSLEEIHELWRSDFAERRKKYLIY